MKYRAAYPLYVREIPMQPQTQRRRVPRYSFKAASVVTEIGSPRIVVAPTSDLSRFGCFVQAPSPFPQGSRIHIEMVHEETTFVAFGKVAYATGEGMGIVFSTVEADDQAILEKWLVE